MEKKSFAEVFRGSAPTALFGLLYVLLPFDLVPDFFHIAGRADDALVICACAILIRRGVSPRPLRFAAWLGVAALISGNYFALNYPPPVWFYNMCYRVGAPWDRTGMDPQLENFMKNRLSPGALAPGRAIDLGCGSGAYTIYMARLGFSAVGVDFSAVALDKARLAARAAGSGGAAIFIAGDLTAGALPGVNGPFDLLLDVSTLDDLAPAGRRAMAELVTGLSRPGSVFISCSHVSRPPAGSRWFSLVRSAGVGQLEPGEINRLFGGEFDIDEPYAREPGRDNPCFVLTRRNRSARRPDRL